MLIKLSAIFTGFTISLFKIETYTMFFYMHHKVTFAAKNSVANRLAEDLARKLIVLRVGHVQIQVGTNTRGCGKLYNL